jgi:hypothetical protein
MWPLNRSGESSSGHVDAWSTTCDEPVYSLARCVRIVAVTPPDAPVCELEREPCALRRADSWRGRSITMTVVHASGVARTGTVMT